MFDAKNVRAIERRFPTLRTPVVALGDLLERPIEILNPDGADTPYYERRFAEVGEGIDKLIAVLTDRTGAAAAPTAPG